MRRLVALVLAACGAGGESADIATPAPPHAVVTQQAQTNGLAGGTSMIEIAPTTAHALLVVVVAVERGYVRSIRLAGHPLARDSVPIDSSCGRNFELWTRPDVEDGATEVDVELTEPGAHAVYVIEATGLSRFGLVETRNIGTVGTEPPAFDAQLGAQPGSLVISTVRTCQQLLGLDPAGGFVPFEAQHGVNVALLVASEARTYAAHWLMDGGPMHAYIHAYR